VPGLEGQGRSEGLVLKRTVDFMREQLAERQAMIERIEQSGGKVDDRMKR
jgi:septum formation protein